MQYSVWIAKTTPNNETPNEKYRRIGGEYGTFQDAEKAFMQALTQADLAKGTKVKMVATR